MPAVGRLVGGFSTALFAIGLAGVLVISWALSAPLSPGAVRARAVEMLGDQQVRREVAAQVIGAYVERHPQVDVPDVEAMVTGMERALGDPEVKAVADEAAAEVAEALFLPAAEQGVALGRLTDDLVVRRGETLVAAADTSGLPAPPPVTADAVLPAVLAKSDLDHVAERVRAEVAEVDPGSADLAPGAEDLRLVVAELGARLPSLERPRRLASATLPIALGAAVLGAAIVAVGLRRRALRVLGLAALVSAGSLALVAGIAPTFLRGVSERDGVLALAASGTLQPRITPAVAVAGAGALVWIAGMWLTRSWRRLALAGS